MYLKASGCNWDLASSISAWTQSDWLIYDWLIDWLIEQCLERYTESSKWKLGPGPSLHLRKSNQTGSGIQETGRTRTSRYIRSLHSQLMIPFTRLMIRFYLTHDPFWSLLSQLKIHSFLTFFLTHDTFFLSSWSHVSQLWSHFFPTLTPSISAHDSFCLRSWSLQ